MRNANSNRVGAGLAPAHLERATARVAPTKAHILSALAPLFFVCICFAQDSLNVRLVGHYDTGSEAYRVYVSGSYAYVADCFDGLRIIDVSDPVHPSEVGFYDTGNMANGVFVSGSYAYVANGYGGLHIIDVFDPAHPLKVGSFNTGGEAYGVFVSGSYAYVADYGDGLRIINVSNAAHPSQVGFYNTESYAYGVFVSGSYAYIADRYGGLRVIDVSDPAYPSEVGFYDTGDEARCIFVSGSYAYVADQSDGLYILDVSYFTGIEEQIHKPQMIEINVSPNPFNAACEIRVTSYELRVTNVEIFGLNGKSVWWLGAPITDNRSPITEFIWRPIKSIPSGVYFIRATTGDGNAISKRIVYLK